MITHVAIRKNGVVCSMPKPYRHADIINRAELKLHNNPDHLIFQGFLRDGREFLTREESLTHANECNQLLPGKNPGRILTSEDVW